MKKIFTILVIGMLAITMGCASKEVESEQQKPVRMTLDGSRSYVKDSYLSDRGYKWEAGQGKTYVALYFIVENISYSRGFDFRGYNMVLIVDNVEYNRCMYLGPSPLEDVTIMPGGKIEGFVLYEIPEKYNSIHWRYDNSPIAIEPATKK